MSRAAHAPDGCGGLIIEKVLIAVEEPDTATESTPLATTLQIRQSTRPLPR